MIFTEHEITIVNNSSKLDKPIILYRGDKNIEVRFRINKSPYKYSYVDDIDYTITSENASYAQLAIRPPGDELPIFSDIVEVDDDKIVFNITTDMMDELKEVGFYDFQIRLMDESRTSRASIPPVYQGLEIREPIVIEDVNSNKVQEGGVDHASAESDGTSYPIFDSEGNYIKTNWQKGDIIVKELLNKAEDGIYQAYALGINNSSQIKEMTYYVTPEMFGAKGDGVTDDTNSIKNALKNGKKINLTNNKKYLISEYITINSNTEITGNGELYFKNSSISSRFNPSLIDVYDANNVKIKGIKITADCNKTSSLVRIANCSDIEIADNDITFKREDGMLNLVIDVHNNNKNIMIHNNNIKHLTINTEYGGIINVNNNNDGGNVTGLFTTKNIVIKNNSFYSSSGDEMVCLMNIVEGAENSDITIINNIFKRPIETIKTHMLAISSKYDDCVKNVIVQGNMFISEAKNATAQLCAIRLGAEGEGIGKIRNIIIQNNSICGYLDQGIWCVPNVTGEVFISNNSFTSIENKKYAINNNIMDIVAVNNYVSNFNSVYNVLNSHLVGENFLNNKMSGRNYIISRKTYDTGNISINLATYSEKYSIKFYGVYNSNSVNGVISVLSETVARGFVVKPDGVESITCTIANNVLQMEIPAYSVVTFESTNYIN